MLLVIIHYLAIKGDHNDYRLEIRVIEISVGHLKLLVSTPGFKVTTVPVH